MYATGRLGVPQSWSGRRADRNTSLPLPGTENRFSFFRACGLVTVMTELYDLSNNRHTLIQVSFIQMSG